jgi:hypothetical protein
VLEEAIELDSEADELGEAIELDNEAGDELAAKLVEMGLEVAL